MSIKQIGTRNMGFVVEQMEWSNKMDLLAFGNNKGEVIVQRFNWQKVITFPSPGENVRVSTLSWQSGETMLAVGYNNGKVGLFDIEREELASGLDYKEEIHKVYFSQPIVTVDHRNPYKNGVKHKHDYFLPPLPSLNGISSASKTLDEHKSFAKGEPCFLVVILKSGKVHFLLLGALKAGTIDLSQHVSNPDDFEVFDVRSSGNFHAVYALVRDGNQLKLLHFNNSILEEYLSPLLQLAGECANVLEVKNYINETIHCMLEAWETVVLEMDNKLTRYANQQTKGALSADFLEFLTFGYASHDFEEFLMDELTEKGAKKLATSIDLSYSAVHGLVAKQLHLASVKIFYFLNTIRGLGRINYFFEPLIEPSATKIALHACGSFALKVSEFEQAIGQAINDMKLFFNWFIKTIMHLTQQTIPDDMKKLTQQEINYLAEYLNNFEDTTIITSDGTTIKKKFNLEKVGQYLEDAPLQFPMKTNENDFWEKLLEENECLANAPHIYNRDKDLSLMQQLKKMLDAIDKVFEKANNRITNSYEKDGGIVLSQLPYSAEYPVVQSDFIRHSFLVNKKKNCDMWVTTIGWEEALILAFNNDFTQMRTLWINLQPSPGKSQTISTLTNLQFIDLDFYNDSLVSMMIHSNANDSIEKQQCFLIQFPLDETMKEKTELYEVAGMCSGRVKPCDLVQSYSVNSLVQDSYYNFKNLEGCTHMAVSGSRKVAAVLFEACRKMALFEMEAEEDDDETTELSGNSTLENSKSSAASTSMQE